MTEKSVTAYEDLPFMPLAEGSPVEFALLWGDLATGPAAIMVRSPAGHAEPWHSHTNTYHAVLIKGQFQSRSRDDEAPPIVGPGSFIVQPGGEVHAEVNAGEGDVVALVYFDGPVDFVPAE